ncbi:MAG: NUDIX domain-containing protein [Candidatus Eisenbacteria bacterium]
MSNHFLSDDIRALFQGRPAPERPEGYDDLRQAAAFFLLVDRDETHAFLVKKKETPGYTWSGQVGMVGGMIERGEGDLEAAFREFEEELSLRPESLELLGDLGYYSSSVVNAFLHVFVARWSGEGDPVPDPAEIDYMIEVPFSVLEEIHEREKYPGKTPDPDGKGPFYPVRVDGRGRLVVWGVTARITHALLEMLRGE